jgi:hypothetical protein
MSTILSFIVNRFKLIRNFFVDLLFGDTKEFDFWLAVRRIINKLKRIIIYSIMLIPRFLKLMRDFFVDVLFGGINELVFSLAVKKSKSKLERVMVYSLTLIPLATLFIFCIITKFNVESEFDTVMLYIFTTGTLIAYVQALKIILSKVK